MATKAIAGNRKRGGRLKVAAIVISSVPWLIFFTGILSPEFMANAQWILIGSCLLLSPLSVACVIQSFRGTTGLGQKVFWILWCVVPFLFAVILVVGAFVFGHVLHTIS